MPDAPAYCTRKPGAAERDAVCPDCGHAALLHVGVGHCPVCEIVAFCAKARRQPVTPGQVARGEKTIDDMRAYLGMPPLTAMPEVGATVHYLWAARDGSLCCIPASVGGIHPDGTRPNLDMPFGAAGPAFADAVDEDPSMCTASTWHWPCEKAESEPEPDTPPTTVNIHVHGGVLTERQLADAVQRGITRHLAAQYSSRNFRR